MSKDVVYFEKAVWWDWYWQNATDTSLFFAVGTKSFGPRENNEDAHQFFFASRDTVLSNFYMERLVDFDHKKRWKLIYTNEDQYLKIQELSSTRIEIYGPVDNQDDLSKTSGVYERMPDDATLPFDDSIRIE